MKIANIIMAAASTALLAGGVALAATPAHASADKPLITERYDEAYEGENGYLASGNASGDTVYYSESGSYNLNVDYQLESGSYGYWIHPAGHDSLCDTASTTQKGVIKVEACVTPTVYQQIWQNTASGGYYQNFSVYWGEYLNDPNNGTGTYAAGLSGPDGYGINGETDFQN